MGMCESWVPLCHSTKFPKRINNAKRKVCQRVESKKPERKHDIKEHNFGALA